MIHLDEKGEMIFPGWVLATGNIRTGDVFVRYGLNRQRGVELSPELGESTTGVVGRDSDSWNEAMSWRVYRKAGPPIPRRLALSKIGSRPLPLP